jgi:hypothetical protein
LDEEKAKNVVNLSESEIMTILQLLFELGILYGKAYTYNLDSYAERFYNKFSTKKGIQLYFFLQTVMILEPSKFYKPNELNKICSTNLRNFIPKLSNFGVINDDQIYSLKKMAVI